MAIEKPTVGANAPQMNIDVFEDYRATSVC